MWPPDAMVDHNSIMFQSGLAQNSPMGSGVLNLKPLLAGIEPVSACFGVFDRVQRILAGPE
jgi:hypothetical protein